MTARIEHRVAVGADSSTRRFQKMLVVVTALVGSAATVVNALPFLRDGLDALAWTYLGSAGFLAAGGLIILGWPTLLTPATFVLLLTMSPG